MKPRLFQLASVLLVLSACASPLPKAPPLFVNSMKTSVLATNQRFVVVRTGENETFSSLAQTYLGSADRGEEIADFNQMTALSSGQVVAIPQYRTRIPGLSRQGVQTIPILCYHRFGNGGGKMSVSAEAFAAQLAYLRQNHYTVVALDNLLEFLEGKRTLPDRSVVITIDDGYRSTFEIAYPLLKKFAFPATVFLYTDFVGASDALSWPQMKEMVDSGFILIQPHTKTHTNLAVQYAHETPEAYLKRIESEIDQSGDLISQRLGVKSSIFAYPYGDTNEKVVQLLQRNHYALAVTVQAGTNTPFAPPYMLKRTMVYGDQDIQEFSKALVIFREFSSN
ncbi:MAG: polysaccharide deacetylase family protein [Gammaproteobacteria bacterium]|nr:polysaccharide deacetylase family protein [Gammaproteobacteria bacterium]